MSISIIQSIRLSSICAAALLLSCCAASSVSAREPKPKSQPQPATDVIAIELRELGEVATKHEFVVPLDGRIAGWTELYGERHYCRVDADRTNDARVGLTVRCGNNRELQIVDFDFKVLRALELGEPTVLAELSSRGEERIQVVATRR